jgi:hypothetical protein
MLFFLKPNCQSKVMAMKNPEISPVKMYDIQLAPKNSNKNENANKDAQVV